LSSVAAHSDSEDKAVRCEIAASRVCVALFYRLVFKFRLGFHLSPLKEIPRKKIVMISSTALDLPDHRGEIREGCERAGFEPHMMEKLPARDADAIKVSRQMVEEADVYVGVFAFRYGYVPEGHDISITEMEYNRAGELELPRLVFFIHDDHPITKKDVETGPGEAKLQALKDRIRKERVVTLFHSPKDLRAQVVMRAMRTSRISSSARFAMWVARPRRRCAPCRGRSARRGS
jgi:Domain of unknown function (DUF4062)